MAVAVQAMVDARVAGVQFGRHVLQHPVAEAEQAPGLRAYPEITVRVRQQFLNGAGGKKWRVLVAVEVKVEAVVAHQAPLRAEPQVPVRRLRDGVDGRAGEPLLRAPTVARVVGRPAVRV